MATKLLFNYLTGRMVMVNVPTIAIAPTTGGGWGLLLSLKELDA